MIKSGKTLFTFRYGGRKPEKFLSLKGNRVETRRRSGGERRNKIAANDDGTDRTESRLSQ